MLTSLAIILLLGLLLGSIFQKMKLPSLIGMILTGVLLGPYALDILDPSILSISPDLRQLALVIILTRAGLALDIKDLKKVGRSAILMCFLPACIEIIGVVLLAPWLLGITTLEAFILGAVLAAVSPAVVVPRMLRIMEEGYGTKKSIPQMILAGTSVDDVFVIVVFTAATAIAVGDSVTMGSFVSIPISIILGILVGVISGILFCFITKKIPMRDSVKVIVLLSISFLLIECEKQLEGNIPISGLLAIMSMGIMIYYKNNVLAKSLSVKYNKLWVAAELILFVLVGATVDVKFAISAGIFTVIVVVGAILFRMIGVIFCLIKTDLSKKEKIFCMVAYTPKATVQAAIGGIPLAMGLECGQLVITVAVLSILITAPFGAICMDRLYKKLLTREESNVEEIT